MNEKSTLYWSPLRLYEDCPQAFLWSKGWDGIDLGNGPGKGKTKPPEALASSRHHAVMGIVIQYAIEKMYNDELWRDPKRLPDTLLEIVDREWARQEAKSSNNMDYRNIDQTRSELLQICRDGVLGYLKTMKANRLLGPYARAEVDLVGWVDKYTQVGGRADMIIRRDDSGVTILDGKNTKKRGSSDPDQLRWYALLYKLSYRELPNRLAFVYYRFPHDPESEETGVDWINFTEDDLRGLAQRVLDAKKAMWKGKFDPTPTPPKCQYCDFQTVCPARQAQRAANAAKRSPKTGAATLALGEKDDTGFVDFSL